MTNHLIECEQCHRWEEITILICQVPMLVAVTRVAKAIGWDYDGLCYYCPRCKSDFDCLTEDDIPK